MVALGKDDIKTIEDLAGCATDDLAGWTERQNGETKRFKGTLSDFDISRQEAEDIIMLTRVAAGWIDPSELLSDEEAMEYEMLEGEEALDGETASDDADTEVEDETGGEAEQGESEQAQEEDKS